jgi:hypothetical protein
MKKKVIIPIVLLLALLAAGFISLQNTGTKTQPCRESMEECCKKKSNGSSPDGQIWESLSRQFFSFSGQTN